MNLAFSRGENIYCAFIDFHKAFDYLNRDCLWHKMLHNGIRGKIIDMIRSMCSEVKSRVKYLGKPSEDFHSYLGVRQKERLSPFLFCLCVNDLKETLVDRGIEGVSIDDFKLCSLLYADDSIIISSNKEELQNSLDILHDYCQTCHLYVKNENYCI